MYNSKIPNDQELPSSKQLLISTVLAAAVATLLLLTVVLPAEYAIDPTGIGQMLGLKKMGEIKTSLEAEAQSEQEKVVATSASISAPSSVDSSPTVSDTAKAEVMTVTLAPNQGAEIKAIMQKGATINYKWASDGKTNFDTHADSEELQIKYHNYDNGSQTEKEGTITAAFNGKHGWFWRNRTDKTITVKLTVSGDYKSLVRIL